MGLMLWRRPPFCYPHATMVTIGNFDGIHQGHQHILKATASLARQFHATPLLLTFEPYPQTFLHPEKPLLRLTSLREKMNLVSRILPPESILYFLPFNQRLSHYSPDKFIQDILIKQLNAKGIVVGEDFRFGYQRKGDITLLQTFLDTHIILPVTEAGERISSTRVRKALTQGNLALAEKLLVRPYTITGRVIYGSQRGRQLGFPTANIALHRRILPLEGVFAVRVNQHLLGAANVGRRPTVAGNQLCLEVHLLDFNQNLYGQYLNITFIQKIRDEIRFSSLEALKQQIAQDVARVKAILC